MNKIKANISDIKTKATSNLRQIALESLFIAITLVIISILLFSNIVRVITTGKSNYDTFLKEQESLKVIQAINDDLIDDYEYVNSDEYKKILLRDSLGLADQSERLFRTKEASEYYDEEIELFKLRDKTNYDDWWLKLLNI